MKAVPKPPPQKNESLSKNSTSYLIRLLCFLFYDIYRHLGILSEQNSILCFLKDVFIQALFRYSEAHPVSESFLWPPEYVPVESEGSSSTVWVRSFTTDFLLPLWSLSRSIIPFIRSFIGEWQVGYVSSETSAGPDKWLQMPADVGLTWGAVRTTMCLAVVSPSRTLWKLPGTDPST